MSVEVNSYSDLEVKPGDLLAFPSISSHSSNGENTADRTMSSTSLHSNSSGARLKQTSRTESPAESSAGSAECGEAWGVLSHQFNFLSAYEHHCIKRLLPRLVCPEVTTQHGGMDYGGEGAVGLTVDFVFYTGGYNHLIYNYYEYTGVSVDQVMRSYRSCPLSELPQTDSIVML